MSMRSVCTIDGGGGLRLAGQSSSNQLILFWFLCGGNSKGNDELTKVSFGVMAKNLDDDSYITTHNQSPYSLYKVFIGFYFPFSRWFWLVSLFLFFNEFDFIRGLSMMIVLDNIKMIHCEMITAYIAFLLRQMYSVFPFFIVYPLLPSLFSIQIYIKPKNPTWYKWNDTLKH